MKQFTQKLRSGEMRVNEVPVPMMNIGEILVCNHFSLISAGTESSTVKAARKGYFGKARERPQQVKQVLETLKTQGPVQTYRAVMKKLDSYSPLGYSCTGEVIDVSPGIKLFKVGDLVACGGLSAAHAEVVSVPVNLCVKLHPDTDLKQAVYNTLGSIALQGVRQADLRLGEICAIIGLGLLGQLTALLLRASGIKVVGIDIDPNMLSIGKNHCLDLSVLRDGMGIENKILDFTTGLGCDAVIITAATDSLDPINFAGSIVKKRGTIVVVGAVPTGFEREPYFYQKELQVRMSCSYGPGRYDPIYEEKGIDYPPAYVRWTENRNMQAFQDLIYRQKIDVSYLTTHTFQIDDLPAAYDMIMNKTEPYIGILVQYSPIEGRAKNKTKINLKTNAFKPDPSVVSIGFIGAGSYAQSHLIPNLPKNNKEVKLIGVATATSTGARSAGERFGFEFCTTRVEEILENDAINTIFIASRHNTHGKYVIDALKNGKNVFVEKPICITMKDLETVAEIIQKQAGTVGSKMFMVGYNRRFSPHAEMIKAEFGDGPMAMLYRINAGYIPPDSWYQDPDIGGGRIIGEVCHFVDLLTFFNGSLPTVVHATLLPDVKNLNDIIAISITYKNGSIGTICYFANGDKSLPKERVEVFANGLVGVIDDFKYLTIYGKGKKKTKRFAIQNKGQKNEIDQYIHSILMGKGNLISFEELYNTSLVTFKIIECIRTGQPQYI